MNWNLIRLDVLSLKTDLNKSIYQEYYIKYFLRKKNRCEICISFEESLALKVQSFMID